MWGFDFVMKKKRNKLVVPTHAGVDQRGPILHNRIGILYRKISTSPIINVRSFCLGMYDLTRKKKLTVPKHAVVDQRGPHAAHEREHGNGGGGRRGRQAKEEGHRHPQVEEEEQQKHRRCEHHERQSVPDSQLQRLLVGGRHRSSPIGVLRGGGSEVELLM